jgi:sarcosine oxidase, subunit gamma
MPESRDSFRLLEPAARFILQGGPAARDAAGQAFGVALPEVACRANSDGERSALWLGPDEYLLLAPEGVAERVAAEIAIALSGVAHSLVDVSDRQVAIALTVPTAGDILSHGCPLDLDPAEFTIGMCTRTVFGKADIVLWRKDAATFHLEVWRSFSNYLLGYLREAARDFATPAR